MRADIDNRLRNLVAQGAGGMQSFTASSLITAGEANSPVSTLSYDVRDLPERNRRTAFYDVKTGSNTVNVNFPSWVTEKGTCVLRLSASAYSDSDYFSPLWSVHEITQSNMQSSASYFGGATPTISTSLGTEPDLPPSRWWRVPSQPQVRKCTATLSANGRVLRATLCKYSGNAGFKRWRQLQKRMRNNWHGSCLRALRG